MNNARRKKLKEIVSVLEKAKSDIEGVLNDEQDALDNLPEGFQDSEWASAMQDAMDSMENSMDAIDDGINYLQEIN